MRPILIIVLIIGLLPVINASGVTILNPSPQIIIEDEQLEQDIFTTVVITKTRRLKNFAYDQTWYDYTTDKAFDEHIYDILNERSNYQDKIATPVNINSIDRGDYSKYYQCYHKDYDYYYNDYDKWNPCLN